MIYRNYWTLMTSEDYDIMYRKGTSHRDLYKVQDTKDAEQMFNRVNYRDTAQSSVEEIV